MTIAVIQYVVAGRMLGDIGRTPHRPLDPDRHSTVLRRIVVRLNGTVSDAVYYGLLGAIAAAAGVVFLPFAGRIRSLMAGVD